MSNIKNPYVTIYVPTMPNVNFKRNITTENSSHDYVDTSKETFKVPLCLLKKSNLNYSINMKEIGSDAGYIEVIIISPSGTLLRQCLVKRTLYDRNLIMEVREINESMQISEIFALAPLAVRLGCKYLSINKKYSKLIARHSS